MKEFMTVEKIMELIIGGLISCIITLAVTFAIDKIKDKKRVDVDETPTQGNIPKRSDENLSEILKYADIHDNTNCDIHVNIYSDQKSDQEERKLNSASGCSHFRDRSDFSNLLSRFKYERFHQKYFSHIRFYI